MRKTMLLLPAVVATAFFGANLPCCAGTAAAAEGQQNEAQQKRATSTFRVTGMTCGGCEVGVEKVVKKLEGVEEVTASYGDKQAVVSYDPAKVTPQAIIAAIEKLGYQAELKQPKKARG
jgi:copper chaperone CopZ